jgi:hypothetical protein
MDLMAFSAVQPTAQPTDASRAGGLGIDLTNQPFDEAT